MFWWRCLSPPSAPFRRENRFISLGQATRFYFLSSWLWDVTCLIRQPTRSTLELADTSPQRAPSFSAISSSLLAIVRLVLGSARPKSWRLLQRNERLDLSSITSGPVFRNCEGSEKRLEEGGSGSCWSPDREYIQPCSTASIGYVVIRLSWRLPRLR